MNAEIAKKSIQSFGNIMVRLPSTTDTLVNQLRNFLALKIDYVTTETFIVLKDVLRKYPALAEEFIPYMESVVFDSLTEVDGKAAYIWIVGEFGELIEDAPYILERMIEAQKAYNSTKISLTLMLSLMKLFFKRPPEVRAMLGAYFEYAIKTTSDLDLRSRAVFYYKLLQTNVELAREIVCG